jgi:hypothetical protein
MVLYLCVLIVFSLHQKLLKLILTMNPSRGGSVTAVVKGSEEVETTKP